MADSRKLPAFNYKIFKFNQMIELFTAYSLHQLRMILYKWNLSHVDVQVNHVQLNLEHSGLTYLSSQGAQSMTRETIIDQSLSIDKNKN